MKFTTTFALLHTAALAAAQFTFDSKDNTFSCAKSSGVAAYCAGGDIIIRCSNGVGEAGNCNDNLAGEVPYGNNGLAGCYQSAPSSGDAACTKAGLVYPASGSGASMQTAPYPIPGSDHPTTFNSTPSAGPSDSSGPYTNTTSGASAQEHHWSNVTVTVTAAPAPAYTAGNNANAANAAAATTLNTVPAAAAPSTGFSQGKPQAYTGAASSSKRSTSPYWAFAMFAVVALF